MVVQRTDGLPACWQTGLATGWQRHLVATHLAVLAWSHRVVYVVGCVPDYERTCGIGARRAEGATLRGKTT